MPPRNVLLLSLARALGMTGPSVVVLLAGIVGADLAPVPELATLPVSLMVLGTALASIPAALIMQRIGRRNGFVGAALLGVGAAGLGAYAVLAGNFLLLGVAALLIGANSAFAQQYRFAAAESVPEAQAGRAVSIVLFGSILAGYLGPEAATRGQRLLQVPYAGGFLALALLFLASAVALAFLKDIRPTQASVGGTERPLKMIVGQPMFLVAMIASAVSYGVMSLIMTATPVHLHRMQGASLDQTALIIQSHVVAMYLPLLFTGWLTERFGVRRLMLAGAVCLFLTVAVGVMSESLLHYWITLVLLGIGWNLLFVGGTVMLTLSYHPAERFKAQAVNDFVVFGVTALASLSAGAMIFRAGWEAMNLLPLPFLVLVVVSLYLLSTRKLAAPEPAASD